MKKTIFQSFVQKNHSTTKPLRDSTIQISSCLQISFVKNFGLLGNKVVENLLILFSKMFKFKFTRKYQILLSIKSEQGLRYDAEAPTIHEQTIQSVNNAIMP